MTDNGLIPFSKADALRKRARKNKLLRAAIGVLWGTILFVQGTAIVLTFVSMAKRNNILKNFSQSQEFHDEVVGMVGEEGYGEKAEEIRGNSEEMVAVLKSANPEQAAEYEKQDTIYRCSRPFIFSFGLSPALFIASRMLDERAKREEQIADNIEEEYDI